MTKYPYFIFILLFIACTRLGARVELPEHLHPYSHGGGYGLAIEMLEDDIWIQILNEQEPKLFKAYNKILRDTKWGLDQETVGKIILLMENSPVMAAYTRAKIGPNFTTEFDIWLCPQHPEMVSQAKIIHGSPMTHKVQASFIAECLFYTDIAGTDIATAITVEDWIHKYKAALYQLATLKNEPPLENMLPRAVCLDVKSDWSTEQEIITFALALQEQTGIKVDFIGSFNQSKLTQIPSNIKAVRFFHGVWDLELAAQVIKLPSYVMFNGADLLKKQDENKTYQINQQAIEKLYAIANRQNVKMGFYVQEPDLGMQAAELLINLAIEKSDLFSLGFAYGGSREPVVSDILDGRGGYDQEAVLSDNIDNFIKTFR